MVIEGWRWHKALNFYFITNLCTRMATVILTGETFCSHTLYCSFEERDILILRDHEDANLVYSDDCFGLITMLRILTNMKRGHKENRRSSGHLQVSFSPNLWWHWVLLRWLTRRELLIPLIMSLLMLYSTKFSFPYTWPFFAEDLFRCWDRVEESSSKWISSFSFLKD